MIFDEFDGIHASDEIKQKTLHNVMKQRSRKKRSDLPAVLILCVTCLLVILFQPWKLMEASPAPAPVPAVYSYVTLDINPSMEWKLDEQKRVVGVTAYNKDADNILSELQLEGMQLDAALRMLLENERFSTYMKSGFLEVSVYSENSSVSFALEQQINQQLKEAMPQNQFHCSHLDDATHQEAQQHHMSAGKYRVIDEILLHDTSKDVKELQKLSMKQLYSILERYDPSAVPEGCHGKQMRKGHHHGS